jgi:hypothetical protein
VETIEIFDCHTLEIVGVIRQGDSLEKSLSFDSGVMVSTNESVTWIYHRAKDSGEIQVRSIDMQSH